MSVENLDQTISNATVLGAAVVEKREIAGLARLATLRDPEGAIFGLWQPQSHGGSDVMEQVGSLWWIEVLSNDVERACSFYERLFGWTSTARPLDPFASYTFLRRS